MVVGLLVVFFFQAEDGIRDLVRSRGLGDVYKRQPPSDCDVSGQGANLGVAHGNRSRIWRQTSHNRDACLLYTSDAADERSSVDLGGRRIIKKKKKRR